MTDTLPILLPTLPGKVYGIVGLYPAKRRILTAAGQHVESAEQGSLLGEVEA